MRSRRFPLSLVLVALATAAGSRAQAGVPSPLTSTVDECLRVCPAGDMNLHIVVRDAQSDPVPNSVVLVDFCNCPMLFICPLFPDTPYGLFGGCIVVMTADAAGVADIPIRAGGGCTGPVNISADGVQLTQRGVISPDENGDGTVNAIDQGILAGILAGPYHTFGDLNCSAALEPGDTRVLTLHLGHSCAATVPVAPRSWGSVKVIYR